MCSEFSQAKSPLPVRREKATAGLAGIGLGLLLNTVAWADEEATTSSTDAEAMLQDLYVTEQLLEGEKATVEILRTALAERSTRSGQRSYDADSIRNVTARDAALKALEANLSVARGDISREIADQVLREAEAIFNPTISVSFNYARSDTHDRTEQDQRYKTATRVIIDDNGAPHDAVVLENPIIRYIGFDQPRPGGPGPTTIKASESSLTGPDETWSYGLGISQILPWGGSAALNQQVTYKVADFVVNEGARDAGLAIAGDYGRPWSVTTTGTVSVPFPFSRGFGRDAAVDTVNVSLSQVSQAAAQEQLQSIINDTLLAVDIAYYELVRAGITVEATRSNRDQTRALQDKTETLFELGQTTSYHKTRVDADVSRAEGQHELALTNYMTASNNLRRLLNEDANVVYVPLGYLATMRRSSEFNVESITNLSPDNNPTVRVEDRNLKAAEIRERQADLQTRPDINFDVRVSFGQSNSVFGYEDYAESMGNMFNADFVDQNFSATFVRPFGNRNLNAGHEAAISNRLAQQFTRKQRWNLVRQQIHNALITHVSAVRRLDLAERRFQLASDIYEQATDKQRNRVVTEYEIIELNQNVLDAHRRVISAIVDAKQAEARVLAGAGMLAERYPERTSLSALDRTRLEKLRAGQVLNYFAENAQ